MDQKKAEIPKQNPTLGEAILVNRARKLDKIDRQGANIEDNDLSNKEVKLQMTYYQGLVVKRYGLYKPISSILHV